MNPERESALALQASWREHHRREVVAKEYLILRESSALPLMPKTYRNAAEEVWKQFAETAKRRGMDHPDHSLLADWLNRVEAQLGRDAFAGDDAVAPALQQLWWAVHRDDDVPLPKGFDPTIAGDQEPADGEPQSYALKVWGHEVWGEPVLDEMSTSEEGTWLSTVAAKAPVARSSAIQHPSWAVDGGTDKFGRWAAFEVAGVRQVMRWIAPGTFTMGAPEDEVWPRWTDEGPQHSL